MSTAHAGANPAAATVAAANPLRIKTLTLTDFRAFPGPAPQAIEFDGKNLLVYGENGSGKSSVFYALSEMFSLKAIRSLRDYKNVFSGEPDTGCSVEVKFTDSLSSARWEIVASPLPGGGASGLSIARTRERHPGRTIGSTDQRITQAALRRACLDYRSLLDTNYKHGADAINLFDIAVNNLLDDYAVAVAGGTSQTIGDLWRAVQRAKPLKHTPSSLAAVNQACANFNAGFNAALSALQPIVTTLLADLPGTGIAFTPLAFAGVTYSAARYKRDRGFSGKTLNPEIRFRSHPVNTPQHFLNEARLSALALAIYLAGRLACTPAVASDVLKLLVLDDVLIGLDHANRLPVLDLLTKHFATWQIVLLTHDRSWFDMARGWLEETAWHCVEIFEGDALASAPMPVVRATANYPAKQYLEHAKKMLSDHYVEASANYARQAFEAVLRGECQRKGIPVAFQQNSKDVKAEVLLKAVEDWAGLTVARQKQFGPVLTRLRQIRNVVMNPYSHPMAPNIPTTEVLNAISDVEKLINAFAAKP